MFPSIPLLSFIKTVAILLVGFGKSLSSGKSTLTSLIPVELAVASVDWIISNVASS